MKRTEQSFRRDRWGVAHVRGNDLQDVYRGLGCAHARDRGLQMLFMRILGQGRVSECLDARDGSLAIDTFFRKMNWSAGMDVQATKFTPETRALIDAYCDGANAVFARSIPWELKLLGCRPEPWTAADSLLFTQMTGYLTLAQGQAEIERFIVEMVQAGISREKLEELFPGRLEGLDIDLLRGVRLGERVVPAELFTSFGARMMASNNWVVSGSRTVSGFPIFSNDIHLEVNRLPAVWYEVVAETPGRWVIAATMPGLPVLIAGRTSDLAWGVTYPYLDASDSWVERCRDGKYWREDRSGSGEWKEFRRRTATIRRKGKDSVEVTFWENDHGVLDGDPSREGLYLATRWAVSGSGAASLNAFAGIFQARSVEEGRDLLGRAETAWSWGFADRRGSIGFQMSGLLPRRRPGASGLVALPGWDPRNDWQGYADPTELPRALNPSEGFLVTANQDLNRLGVLPASTVAMGAWRADRIASQLAKRGKVGVDDMKSIQADLYSTEAEAYLAILRPLLPDTPAGRALAAWDCCYDSASHGATLFERFYRELRREVFGRNGLGEKAVAFLDAETGVFTDFYDSFEKVLLSADSAWFGGEKREAIWRRAAERALAQPAEPWGRSRRVTMSHILFGGKMPRFLGFDRGPIMLPGGRATVHQGQIYRSAGRVTCFAPSIRIITDLGEDEVHTALAGGVTDRRFSRWYVSDLKRWLRGEYKRLTPGA
ncbi:MAG: penicillin acylase family protein [Spirochaetes bacterium]|nr:penicillin acylase family protein [Spirochaetota bacterium]